MTEWAHLVQLHAHDEAQAPNFLHVGVALQRLPQALHEAFPVRWGSSPEPAGYVLCMPAAGDVQGYANATLITRPTCMTRSPLEPTAYTSL